MHPMIYYAEAGAPDVPVEVIQPSEQDPGRCAAMMAACIPELRRLHDRLRPDCSPLTLERFPEEYRYWIPTAEEPGAPEDVHASEAVPATRQEEGSIGLLYVRRANYTDFTSENTAVS